MPVVLAETCRIWILSKVASALRMVIGPKYNGKYLHALLRQYLGDLRLEMMLTNVVIPAFDVAYLQPTIFSVFEVTEPVLLSAGRSTSLCIQHWHDKNRSVFTILQFTKTRMVFIKNEDRFLRFIENKSVIIQKIQIVRNFEKQKTGRTE
jgi:hypothetical protein